MTQAFFLLDSIFALYCPSCNITPYYYWENMLNKLLEVTK